MLRQLKNSNTQKQEGGSLVEIVIVSGIIMSSLAAILGLAAFFLATSHVVAQTSQATTLAQEAMEIVRNFRDGKDWSADFASLTPGDPYHPEQVGVPPEWSFVSGSETIGEFTRQTVFEQVCRNGSDDITDCPGSYTDNDTRKALVEVSWEERGRSHQVELEAYFTNWQQ